ncbi:MAG TPA: glycosyltransferase family 39 protein, partial [Candidatus Acidoferrales bacterium]|nr:glycosyltransferase family 39 protein [Candidatus Acidoferrales bacterium]
MPDQDRQFLGTFQDRLAISRESAAVTYPGLLCPSKAKGTLHPVFPPPRRNIRRQLFWMVLVALLVRLIVVAFIYPRDLDPSFNHWFFGFEEGRVARAIATGHGFSDPLWGHTGPTAWYAPIYPYILALDFKLFGVFTTSACIAILCFQSLVSALACLPIFFFTRRSFGEGAALAAGWVWVVYPYSVYWPIVRIWETWLAMSLLAVLFLLVQKLARSSKLSHWLSFGLLSGFAALLDPALLSVLPFLALWAVWRLHSQGKRWFAPAVTAVLAVILVLSPWMIRNAVVFHKFIPIRDNLALEFRVGNDGNARETMDLYAGPWLPWVNDIEWNQYQRMGEIAYFQLKGHQAFR